MATNTQYEVVDSHTIAEAWAGQTGSFALYTHEDHQFVAFYASDRSITLGQRRLGETDWTLSTVCEDRNDVWDNHNSLALAVDATDHLHLAGDLHVDPLNYWRSSDPLDVTSVERATPMVGDLEDRTTYPEFLRGPDDELLFRYRHGHSGSGNWIYNVYDADDQRWERLFDEPLLEGGERVSAYTEGPVRGPDGTFHHAWGWRDHGAAQQQHDIYYARSTDLRTWETSQGGHVELPITEAVGELVDPVPPWGGNLNGVFSIGFDDAGQVILTYVKYDPDGNSQIYNARADNKGPAGLNPEGWTIYRTSDWDYRDAFGGGGSLGTQIHAGPVQVEPEGQLSQTYTHPVYGTGKWILDSETLSPVEWLTPWNRYPADLDRVRSEHPDMRVVWDDDSGTSPAGDHYALRWEGQHTNEQYVGPDHEAPPATTLECYRFERAR